MCIYVCMYTYIHTYIYVNIYIHTYTYTRSDASATPRKATREDPQGRVRARSRQRGARGRPIYVRLVGETLKSQRPRAWYYINLYKVTIESTFQNGCLGIIWAIEAPCEAPPRIEGRGPLARVGAGVLVKVTRRRVRDLEVHELEKKDYLLLEHVLGRLGIRDLLLSQIHWLYVRSLLATC